MYNNCDWMYVNNLIKVRECFEIILFNYNFFFVLTESIYVSSDFCLNFIST